MEFTFHNETVTVRPISPSSGYVAEIRIVLKDGGSPQYFNAGGERDDEALNELARLLFIVSDVMIELNPYPCRRHHDVFACARAINEKARSLNTERLDALCAAAGLPTSKDKLSG